MCRAYLNWIRRPLYAFVYFILFAVPITFARGQGLPNIYPDGGKLTVTTQVVDTAGGVDFRFSQNVQEKWSGTPEGERKKIALGEVLIYRKFSIEFLLLARDRLKHLGLAIGMDASPEQLSPYELRAALASTFSQSNFEEMNARFIGPSLAEIVDSRMQLDPQTLHEYLKEMLRESVAIVQRDAIMAHADATKADVDSGVSPEEEWRNYCQKSRSAIEASEPLTLENADNEEQKLKARQNRRVIQLFSSINSTDGERLLYTPLNYSKQLSEASVNLTQADFETVLKRTYNEVRSLRKHPTHEGMLAHVIVAYALANLRERGLFSFSDNKHQARSSLACMNWSEINFDGVSDSVWMPIQAAMKAASTEALEINKNALLYLLQLSPTPPLQAMTGFKSWSQLETEPSDPQKMLDKFVDLVPIFQGSAKLRELVRERYPVTGKNVSQIENALLIEARQKEARIRGRQTQFAVFNVIAIAGFVTTWRIQTKMIAFFLVLSDAAMTALVMWPDWRYQKDIRNLLEALFINVEPGWAFDIQTEDIHNVTILDKNTGRDLGIAVGALALVNVWLGAPAAWRAMRTFVGTTKSGNPVLLTERVIALQIELMKYMKMLETKFPNTAWQRIVNQRYLKEYNDKIRRFFPGETGVPYIHNATPEQVVEKKRGIEALFPKLFPDVYKKMQDIGFSVDMDPADRQKRVLALIQQGTKLKPDASLWRIADALGFVDESLSNSTYMTAVSSAYKNRRSSEATSLLRKNFKRPIERLLDEIETEIKVRKGDDWLVIQDPLDKTNKHVQSMRKAYDEALDALGYVPYDDAKSKEVIKSLARLRLMERNPRLEPLFQGLRRFVRSPQDVFSKVIPIEAIKDTELFQVINRKMLKAGENPYWNGITEGWKDATDKLSRAVGENRYWKGATDAWMGKQPETKADANFVRFMRNLGNSRGKDWTVSKNTISTWKSQGIVYGVPINIFGDRISRKARFGPDEWDETGLNIVTGVAESFLKTAFMTGSFTFSERMAWSMGITMATNVVITVPYNMLKLGFTGTPWNQVFNTVFDPECVRSLTQRLSYAAFFHGLYSTGRNRGTFVLRNIFSNPRFGGIGNGAMTMGASTELFIISLTDKVVAGSGVWQASSKALGATGKCSPIKGPFEEDARFAVSTQAESERFTQQIEEDTGLKVNLTDEEIDRIRDEMNLEEDSPHG